MLKYMSCLLVVENITTSRNFYEQVLGQTVQLDFGVNISYNGNFAIHAREHYQGLLGDAHKTSTASRPHNVELYFETDDLDSIHERIVQANVEFLHDIVEQPWRQRVMRFYDPDGHIIEIGETMEQLMQRLHAEGLTVDAISEATGLPVPFVEETLKPA